MSVLQPPDAPEGNVFPEMRAENVPSLNHASKRYVDLGVQPSDREPFLDSMGNLSYRVSIYSGHWGLPARTVVILQLYGQFCYVVLHDEIKNMSRKIFHLPIREDTKEFYSHLGKCSGPNKVFGIYFPEDSAYLKLFGRPNPTEPSSSAAAATATSHVPVSVGYPIPAPKATVPAVPMDQPPKPPKPLMKNDDTPPKWAVDELVELCKQNSAKGESRDKSLPGANGPPSWHIAVALNVAWDLIMIRGDQAIHQNEFFEAAERHGISRNSPMLHNIKLYVHTLKPRMLAKMMQHGFRDATFALPPHFVASSSRLSPLQSLNNSCFCMMNEVGFYVTLSRLPVRFREASPQQQAELLSQLGISRQTMAELEDVAKEATLGMQLKHSNNKVSFESIIECNKKIQRHIDLNPAQVASAMMLCMNVQWKIHKDQKAEIHRLKRMLESKDGVDMLAGVAQVAKPVEVIALDDDDDNQNGGGGAGGSASGKRPIQQVENVEEVPAKEAKTIAELEAEVEKYRALLKSIGCMAKEGVGA